MFYYVKIERAGQVFYVISPKWGVYELSETKEKNTYLWQTEESARNDKRWHHLLQVGDAVLYTRTYQY